MSAEVLDSQVFKHHVERLKAETLLKFSTATIPEWICKHTKINGDPYSFVDHEYQETILRDQSQEVVIKKCSQVGISETSARLALALCAVMKNYTVAYTLPTAGFAAVFMRTRIDPIIQGSPYISSLLHSSTDNSEVKRIGDSYLYLKGAQSSNAPISIPCSHLIHDEIDFSDSDVLSQYQSRLTHSKHKRKTKLSTPTIPNRGIDKEFKNSRRHFNLVKCNHCNHWFFPDYFDHVKVPDYSGDLRAINKTNLHKFRYNEAAVHCPKCGGKPSLQHEHREYVCENSEDHYVAAGYQVTPFDAPNFITPGYLIESSTQYKRYTDFINFGLGMAAEDKESTIMRSELESLLVDFLTPAYGSYVMGLDMGMQCHCVIAFITHDGFMIIVHTEIISVGQVRERRKELARQYRVRMTVVDALPYTETVLAMQSEDRNLYAAVYVVTKAVETHVVVDKEEDTEKGRQAMRQVNINRNKAFDAFMDAIRLKFILKVKDGNDEAWMTQLCDLKRIREWATDGEIGFSWKKSEDGNDHFHHASLYAYTASQIMGVAKNIMTLPWIVSSFKEKVEN